MPKQVPLGDTAHDLDSFLVVYCRFGPALSLHWGNCAMCNGFNPHRQQGAAAEIKPLRFMSSCAGMEPDIGDEQSNIIWFTAAAAPVH